jgi:uncharacterized protein (DUF305 family)
MKTTIVALAFAASLFTLPATAQQGGMGIDAHHPMMQQQPGGGGMPMQGPGMQGMRMMQNMPMMQGMRMMNCPMMGGMAGGMAMSAGPAGDQSVASLALNAVNDKMHRDMAITFTGNVDVDFVTGMIAHHQGAIDMAKVVKAFGADAEIRELAEAIIEAQEAEIAMMRAWLSENAPQ